MYNIMVEGKFSAAHNLRGYKGKCEKLHGHNWRIEAVFSGEKLNKQGTLMDFQKARGKLEQVLKNLDHTYLNELPAFKKINSTSENIARYIFTRLESISSDKNLQLKRVTVWETENASASYQK